MSLERLEGYRRACTDNGVPVEESRILESGYFQKDGYEIAGRLLAENRLNGVEAILGVNDEVALGAMEALWEKGIRIPEDILVAGYGDERYSKYLRIALTSVQQPTTVIAEEACKMLKELIEGEKIANHNVKVQCKLIVRESTMRETRGPA